MKKRPWALSAVAAGLLGIGVSASAQSLPPSTPTPPPSVPTSATPISRLLSQGFESAWVRQPEHRGATLRRDSAAAQAAAARRWTPDAAALETSLRSDRLNRNNGTREVDATLAVPLWLLVERSRAVAAASAESARVDADLHVARWRLAGEVRTAHWTRQRARLEQSLAQARLDSARRLAADVTRRVQAGDLARVDGHQADGTVATAEVTLAEAALAADQADRAWRLLTGLASANASADAEEASIAEPVPIEPANGDSQTDTASHPVLRARVALVDAARRAQSLAGVQTRANPELTLGAVHEREGRGERAAQSIVVGLRIPLGRASGSDARIAAAGAELLEAEAAQALEAEQVRDHVDAARSRLRALQAVQGSAERRAALARETRGFVEKSFRLGETDLPTRLRVELETHEAERQAERSRLDVGEAVSQLRQALGQLPE